MADPTPASIVANMRGGRVSVARNEVLRLMHDLLPGVIAAQNARDGIEITAPKQFYAARESLEGLTLPAVMVGASLDLTAPSPGVMFKAVTVGIFCIGGRIEGRAEIDDMWDTVELAIEIMKTTQRGHCLPDGRLVWNQCIPSKAEQLPGNWDKYSGAAAYFRLDQMGLDLWTPAA